MNDYKNIKFLFLIKLSTVEYDWWWLIQYLGFIFQEEICKLYFCGADGEACEARAILEGLKAK